MTVDLEPGGLKRVQGRFESTGVLEDATAACRARQERMTVPASALID